MSLNTTLPVGLRPYYAAELAAYRTAYGAGDLPRAWRHLERAHILGQRYPFAHTAVHWQMLRFGCRIRSGREVLGQIPRLLLGGVKSFVGRVPVGNPGGADVPPLQPFPIEGDLREILRRVGDERDQGSRV